MAVPVVVPVPVATTPVAAAVDSLPPVTVAVAAADEIDPPSIDDAAAGAALDEFLNTESPSDGTTAMGRVGRSITILGTIFGIGVLAALIWTVRGQREELNAQLDWIRLAGLVIVTGALIEFASLSAGDSAASVGELLVSNPGIAAVLKVAGGLAVAIGLHRGAGRLVPPVQSLSAAVATGAIERGPSTPGAEPHDTEYRWMPTAAAAVGIAGYAVVLMSFWFDGHTVSKGPWVLHAVANLVHLAAAVWAGGVFAMTTIVWMRRRRAESSGLAAMVVRFSSVASISLAAVTVAGLVMAWMILDSPGDLFDTEWGQVLIAKASRSNRPCSWPSSC